MSQELQELQKIIDESNNIVFFGGAGVSTESGIPDFRSTNGLYYQKWNFPPETILSRTFFYENPVEFLKFYREKILIENAQPNKAHKKLAELEQKGKLKAVITQNIDGLHQKAGSKNVYELHGSTLRNYCTKCKKFYDEKFIKQSINSKDGLPYCEECGNLIKPDVVLYEESLNQEIIEKSINAIQNAQTLIIGGTSLTVFPAAGLIKYFSGSKMILINKSQTPQDNFANLVIHEAIGEVLDKIKV